MFELELVEDLSSWVRRAGGSSVVHVDQAKLSSAPWRFAATSKSRQRVFDDLAERCTTRLIDVADIFVGVQSSADKIFFVKPKPARSTSDVVVFDDSDGREWSIEREMTRPALVDRSLEPYEARPVPDTVAIWPYRIVDRGARARAVPISPQELAAQYPRAMSYLQHNRGALLARGMPNPGETFYVYGRTQSLTKMTAPKIIVRVLSRPLSPQYAWDPDGLIVPGGGSGPYYLIRPKSDSPSAEVLIALMSHPVIDAFVIAGARPFRGGYMVHSKQSLQDAPVPFFEQSEAERLVELVREMHDLSIALRSETDSVLVNSMRSRRTWLRGEVEDIVGRTLGLSERDLEHFVE